MITKKLLTEDLKVSRSKDGKLNLKYKDKQLAVIAERVLFQLLIDVAPMSFLKDLAKIGNVADTNESSGVSKGVHKLATVYVYEKLVHQGKKPGGYSDPKVLTFVEKILKDKKYVTDFSNAIKTMNTAETKDCVLFIKSQINGLKFINNGEGVFPKPSQLSTAGALERFYEYTASSTNSVETDGVTKKQDKPKHYWFFNKEIDGTLGLNKNEKYLEALEKIKSGNASMEETLYAQKCFSARRNGSNLKIIEDYLMGISN